MEFLRDIPGNFVDSQDAGVWQLKPLDDKWQDSMGYWYQKS